ncbi:hypothetical protein M0R45_017941 [Rubus argutus]|uniref:C2H2-type domain-containing protein n=1 Tax=Rubus argutus TaxID=59490 RepID=A0AAW1XZ45_RUBAR
MSLPNNNENQIGSSSTSPSTTTCLVPIVTSTIDAIPISSMYPVMDNSHMPAAPVGRINSAAAGINNYFRPNINPFLLPAVTGAPPSNLGLRRMIVYEFEDQLAAAAPVPNFMGGSDRYNYFLNPGTANSASFPGLWYNGGNNFLSHQQNPFGFGTLGPRAPLVPFVSAGAPDNYEAPSTQVPRAASSSISLGGRSGPRVEAQVQSTTDQASSSTNTIALVRQLQNQVDAGGKHVCFECGKAFQSGPALGGHMSSHTKRRKKEEYERALRKRIARGRDEAATSLANANPVEGNETEGRE